VKLPPPEVSNNVAQWLRGATEGQCALKHFIRSGGKSGGQYFAHFNCMVCQDEFKQAADTLSDGIPIKLQEWAAKHAHGVEIEIEMPKTKPKAKAPKVAKQPKPLPTLTQHKGRKFRE